MRILKGDIIAASGEFRASGLECGRLLLSRDTTKASGTTAYEYDLLGRVTESEETRSGPLTFTTAYEYDLAGVVTKITLPSGREVTYGLNANGPLTFTTALSAIISPLGIIQACPDAARRR